MTKMSMERVVELTRRSLRREINDEEKGLIAVAVGATVAEVEESANQLRAALRTYALRRHERLAHGGTFVPSGGSCHLCGTEWNEGDKEFHLPDCLLDGTQREPVEPVAYCTFCKRSHPGGATCMGHYP